MKLAVIVNMNRPGFRKPHVDLSALVSKFAGQRYNMLVMQMNLVSSLLLGCIDFGQSMMQGGDLLVIVMVGYYRQCNGEIAFIMSDGPMQGNRLLEVIQRPAAAGIDVVLLTEMYADRIAPENPNCFPDSFPPGVRHIGVYHRTNSNPPSSLMHLLARYGVDTLHHRHQFGKLASHVKESLSSDIHLVIRL